MFNKVSIREYTVKPDLKKFSEEELKMLDDTGISRHFIEFTFDEYTDETYKVLRDIVKFQYKLPMKYIESEYYRYGANKRYTDKERNYLVIEPLNNNYEEYIRYIPINQSLPLGTKISINIDTSKYKPNYYFFSSNSLMAHEDTSKLIKEANPNSITLKPWLDHVHIGSLDIDSTLVFKGSVSMVNQNIYNSFCLFNFHRDDSKKFFRIYTYDCFNITPRDILKKLSEVEDKEMSKECKEFCTTMLKKLSK